MLTAFIRTVILFIFIVASLRLMGKRQIGQLQPAELVVTILLSEMAATPMQDNDIPLVNTLVSVMVLTGLEIIMSCLSLKSTRLRNLLQGHSVVVISHGVIDQKQLKNLRFSVDDLLEALRQKDVFDVSRVEYAIAETNGSLSVMLRSGEQTLTNADAGIKKSPSSLPVAVIADGEIIKSDIKNADIPEKKIKKALKDLDIPVSEVFLLSLDENGKSLIVRKDKSR